MENHFDFSYKHTYIYIFRSKSCVFVLGDSLFYFSFFLLFLRLHVVRVYEPLFFSLCFRIVSSCSVLAPAQVFNVFLFKNNTQRYNYTEKSKLNIIKNVENYSTPKKQCFCLKSNNLASKPNIRKIYGALNKDKVK